MKTMTEPKNEEVVLLTLRPEELEAIHGGAHYNCRDSDGHVPEHYGSYGEDWLGYTDTVSKKPCQREIYYDTANMKGAGPSDWRRLRAHERAHSRGWDHGQGSPSRNPAHSPYVDITGR
jgi:hypothetical protein